ncbi:MAG: hypothetical protein ACYC3X_06985 [Pirellulaceae bacterium]
MRYQNESPYGEQARRWYSLTDGRGFFGQVNSFLPARVLFGWRWRRRLMPGLIRPCCQDRVPDTAGRHPILVRGVTKVL